MKKNRADELRARRLELVKKYGEEQKAIQDITSEDLYVVFQKSIEDPKNQSWRRIYVRTIYSWIEAMVNMMKGVSVIWNTAFQKKKLTRGEEAIIRETSYFLTDAGLVKKRMNFQDSAKSLRFAFRVYAKVWDIDFQLDVSDQGWQSYLEGLKIRNRVTHPRGADDLYITDKEMDIVMDALRWFSDNFYKLIDHVKSKERLKKPPTVIH